MIAIKLSEIELKLGTLVAYEIFKAIKNHGDLTYDKINPDDSQVHKYTLGNLGEMAVAKAMNWYWHPKIWGKAEFAAKQRLGYPDVGFNVEVRTTKQFKGRLIVKDTDYNDRPYVLVNYIAGEFRLMGWLYGGEAKRQEWIESYYPTQWVNHFVPNSQLRPIETLKDAVEGRLGNS